MNCQNHTNGESLLCDPEYTQEYTLREGKIIASVFIIILVILCIFGNIIMCYLFYRYRRLRIVPNYFIISLAISDLLVGVIAMPLWVSLELAGWTNLPPGIEQTVQCIDIFCCTSSIVNLTAVSIERFFSVYKPLKHRSLMSTKTACCFIALFWIYSSVITFFQFIHVFKEHYLLFIFTMGFMIPLVIVYTSYVSIFVLVRNRKRRRKTLDSSSSDLSITKSLFIVTVVFTLCWLPFFFYALMYRYCTTPSCGFVDTKEFGYFGKFAKWLHYSNSTFNPIIYGMCNVNFRSSFKDLFKCCFKKEDTKSTYEDETQDFRSSIFRKSFQRSSVCTCNSYETELRIIEYRLSNTVEGADERCHMKATDSVHIENNDEDEQQLLKEEVFKEERSIIDKMRMSFENLLNKNNEDEISSTVPDFHNRLLKSQESHL